MVDKIITTLKDVKEALKDIPEEVLKDFGVHFAEEPYTQLLYFGDVEEDPHDEFQKRVEKYPTLTKIDNWITNISKLTLKEERNVGKEDEELAEDISDCVSSEDKIEVPEYIKK